jgi:hypothetical protein
MNHRLLKNNRPKPMRSKPKPMLRRMLLKNLPRNVKLRLKRQNLLSDKPKVPLNA